MANVRWISYPRVSSCDVLQGSGRSLSRCGVDLAALQHLVIQLHYLRVPEPLDVFGLPWHFCKCGEVLILSLEEKTQYEMKLKFENENCNRNLKAASYVFGLLAIRSEAADSFSFWGALSSTRTLQPQKGWWGHLSVQLKGQIPQHTHCVLHTLREEHTHERPCEHTPRRRRQQQRQNIKKEGVTQLPSPLL